MVDPLTTINVRATPQTVQADERQVANSAGGYTFTIDDTAQLRRFLVLGTSGGTYYTGDRELTKGNAEIVLRFARERTSELVDILVELSVAGRAPKQNPTIFALAAAAGLGDDDGRRKALAAVPRVCRTGTHLFLFARYVEQFRGWGRGLRDAVGRWYEDKPTRDLAYQMVKYRQREGWSHRDLLRLAHPATGGLAEKAALYGWVCGREDAPDGLPAAFEAAQSATTVKEWTTLIESSLLSWEMLPDAALAERGVWEALIDKGMPQTALMRQLPRLTRLGALGRMSARTAAVAKQLADPERLRKARVHPVNVLVAARTYASGRSARGDAEWSPVGQITDALDAAFYAAYGAVEPAGKRTLLALDVSGSMAMAAISGMPLTPREASAALALVTAATEPNHLIVGFTSGQPNQGFFMSRARMDEINGLTELAISPRQRLDDAIRAVSDLEFGATDCALPMVWALEHNVAVDTFIVYTDNETWAGSIHPHQALQRYRERTGIDARLAVVAMTATNFSIADPSDPRMLDIAGFDSAVPTLLSDFSRGDV